MAPREISDSIQAIADVPRAALLVVLLLALAFAVVSGSVGGEPWAVVLMPANR